MYNIINNENLGGNYMKEYLYYCDNSDCFGLYTLNEDEYNASKGTYFCPDCGKQLELIEIDEIDPNTDRVIRKYDADGTERDWRPSPPKKRYVPKCPTCGSPNIAKISLASKAAGGFMFGLFSSNVRKTMKCKNCGYKW